MKSHVHPAIKSVRYAVNGIVEALREEPNLRIHIIFAILTILAGIIFRLSSAEWLALITIITLILVLELLNTSLEALTDLASPTVHPKAKLAKDVAAGAVLTAAISSVAIGLIIFLPKILEVFGHF